MSSTKPAAPVTPIIERGSRIDWWFHQSTATAVTRNVGTQIMKPPKVGVPAFVLWEAGWSSEMLFPTLRLCR